MIQRIQTIYLFVASILLLITSLLPISYIIDSTQHVVITIYALKVEINNSISTTKSVLTTGILMYLAIIFSFLTIFLYKNRKLQILISSLLMVISFLICNLIVVNSYILVPSTQAVMSFNYIAIFPLIYLILFFLAYRAIKKDDKLVKSLDRIR